MRAVTSRVQGLKILGAVALCVAALGSGCTKTKKTKDQAATKSSEAGVVATNKATETTDAKAVDLAKRSISLNLNGEPKSMDAQRATDGIAMMFLSHSNEGLTRLDPRSKPFAAQAESWKMISGTKYQFKIRPDAKWSDGKAVTAHDFVYAWQRGVDPKVAAEYAFMLFTLKNAKKINEGKEKVANLGVKAIDAHTLMVELERPVGYFLRLLAFPTYFPARKDIVEQHGESYATDYNKLIYNGPFTITEWKHNSSLTLTKNDKYWNQKNIWLNEIRFPYYVSNVNSEFNMFKDGKYAMMREISKEVLPLAQKNKMQIRKYNDGSVWFFRFNTKGKITANKNFRKAIQTAMNRGQFVREVNGIPGTKPAFGIVPDYMPGVQTTYGQEYDNKFADGELVKAKKYLETARKELGFTTWPKIGILASEDDTTRRYMEYFQSYFKEKLGLEFDLDFQTFKVRLSRTHKGDFDMVNSSWGPDYLDAMTFAELFTSWNPNNNTFWESKAYDSLIEKSMDSTDPKARMDAIFAAEKLLIEDAPIAPYYQRYRVFLQHPSLVGVIRRAVSPDPDFYFAKISQPVAKN